MLTKRNKLRCRRLYVDQEVVVPARHQAAVPARATLLSTKCPTRSTIVETRQMQPGVYRGRTLLPPEHRDLCVSIVNTTAEPKTVAAGEWLGIYMTLKCRQARNGPKSHPINSRAEQYRRQRRQSTSVQQRHHQIVPR